MSTPYIPGPLVQVLDDENQIVVPRQARKAKGPHVYDSTLDAEGKRRGYIATNYEHQEYPKTLYHVDWGKKAKPDAKEYTRGATTPEATESCMTSFSQALQKWERGNRVKTVGNKKEEERLIKIGWLPKPPVRDNGAQFNADSDEL